MKQNVPERIGLEKIKKVKKITDLNEKELSLLQLENKSDVLSDTVEEEDIANIISKWTNIPVSKLVGEEKEKLLASTN